MEDHLSDEEREKLRLENEIRKIKLSLETGAKFVEDPDMPALPPKLENEFLNYIEQFEAMQADSPKITVFEKVGRPIFKPVGEIADEDMEQALEELLDYMMDNCVSVISEDNVNGREMYRFIVEDLFQHEIFDLKVSKDIVTQIFYEDFYPNYEKDIENSIADFVAHFFNKNDELNLYLDSLDTDDERTEKIIEFRNAYDWFDFFAVSMFTIILKDENQHATVSLLLEFDGHLDGDLQAHEYRGYSTFEFNFTPLGWLIASIEFSKPL